MSAQPAIDDVLGPPAALLSVTRGKAESLNANTDEAIQFLDTIDLGRHDLFAIDPYSGKHEARTILKNHRNDARDWIDANQGRRNLYYSVNAAAASAPLNNRLAHKNDRLEIGWRRAFVADLDMKRLMDPDPENVKNEQERLRDVVRDCSVGISADARNQHRRQLPAPVAT